MADERSGTEQYGAKESVGRKDHQAEEGRRSPDDWGDLDQFSAHASRSVLRRMTAQEEAAGLSWSEFRLG